MKRIAAVVMFLMATTADARMCGQWVTNVNIDEITDERIVSVFTVADELDGGFGFRCDGMGSKDLGMAFVTQRFIITKSFGELQGNVMQIRVDRGKVHQVLMYKGNAALWLSYDAEAIRAVRRDVTAGSVIHVRVMEESSYEDYSFSALGATNCLSDLPCR